nr:hypothetical protein [uncultured Pedobacter sp.]
MAINRTVEWGGTRLGPWAALPLSGWYAGKWLGQEKNLMTTSSFIAAVLVKLGVDPKYLYSKEILEQQRILHAKYPVGTILPTPTKNPGDFTKLKNGQGYRRNSNGERWKKSDTSHGNEGNTGEQWKVWPEGTKDKDMGSNSKKSGERTTVDGNGKVIGN